MSVQGAPIHWVADHRKHHDFSDEEGDPHSPHTHGKPGWRGVIGGWWHSHMGWLFSRDDRASASRYARDLQNDPDDRLGRQALLQLGAARSGHARSRSASRSAARSTPASRRWSGADSSRIFLQHHATWSVNSICHMYGKQPFEVEDQSRNNWIVAFVALGEGWHHNHHAFPTSAKHGLQRGQIDPSYMMIKGLEAVGLAWNVRTPSEEAMQKKLRIAGSDHPFENSPGESTASLTQDPASTTTGSAAAAPAASPLADAAHDNELDGSQTAEREAVGVS